MNLGSLFTGLGMPPPNCPPPNPYPRYNNAIIVLLVILIILGFGRTNFGFGGYGFFNYGRPVVINRKHHKHHKHHKCCNKYPSCYPYPRPLPGIAFLDLILVIILGAVLLMQLRPKCNVC